MADLDVATKGWNAWADKNGINDYGVDPGAVISAMSKISTCCGSVLLTKRRRWVESRTAGLPPAPKRPEGDWGDLVVSFSDCSTADGVTFGDMYMPIIEWGKYKGENGSKAGSWVFFPSYGGGKETYDFKWVAAYENLEDLGADWDQFNESGWQKANELFEGKLSCDSARTYLATSRRQASNDD